MVGVVLRKLGRSIAVLVIVSFATFALVYGNGPGIARGVLGGSFSQASPAAVQHEEVVLGLNKPVFAEYWDWGKNAVTGDLGKSFYTGEPVMSTLLNRAPVTLFLIGLTLLFTTLISVLMGVTAAVYGGWIDRVVQFLSVIGTAIPGFIVAIGLLFALAIDERVFPATGYVSPGSNVGQWALSLTLPVVSLLIGSVGGAASQFRGAVVDVLHQDYVRTLRARGIPERSVIFRHVLRNAAGPGLTALSLQTIALIGGVVIIEQVFDLPGIGQLTTSAAEQGDVPVVMGCVLVTILIVLVVNFVSDLVLAALNPKVRLG